MLNPFEDQSNLIFFPFFILKLAVKNELLSKSTEAEAFKSRNMELEECQLRQEDAINVMKRQTKKICVSLLIFPLSVYLCFERIRGIEIIKN